MSYSIKEGLRQAILANAGVAALVSTRVWASFAPLTTSMAGPWIVITKISGQEDSSHSGNAHLSRPRFQLTVGGTDQEKVDEVAQLLIRDFNAATYTHSGRILTIFHADDMDAWEEPTRHYRASVDVYVWANTQP